MEHCNRTCLRRIFRSNLLISENGYGKRYFDFGRHLRHAGQPQCYGSSPNVRESPKLSGAITTSNHRLEMELGDTYEAVQMRRDIVSRNMESNGSTEKQTVAVLKVPAKQTDFNVKEFYDQVHGSSCENVIGFIPVPLGIIGPLLVNGESFMVPLATTEGALLASTNRGARAIRESGGAYCSVIADGMTRSPVVALPSMKDAVAFKKWAENPRTVEEFRRNFSMTTKFGKFVSIECTVVARYVYMRFRAETGDAMGMNMVGKGVNKIMNYIIENYVSADGKIGFVQLISLSSNLCTDKKPSAVNWINGRGKTCVAEVVVSRLVIETVLKTTMDDLMRVNVVKNFVGSSLAGSIGGNNAHAANLVTAFFIANGQDPAQSVESSNCLVFMEPTLDGMGLRVSVTMPSIEVGTIGGGTELSSQKACLEMLGVAGSNSDLPGTNAKRLATIVCATVLAGELSLNSALASNHLISAHMDLNRGSKFSSNRSNDTNSEP